MVYYYNTEFADLGSTNVIIGLSSEHLASSQGDATYLSSEALVKTASLLRELQAVGIHTNVVWPETSIVPLVVLDKISNPNIISLNLTAPFMALLQVVKGQPERITDKTFVMQMKSYFEKNLANTQYNPTEITIAVGSHLQWEFCTEDVGAISIDPYFINQTHKLTSQRINELTIENASAYSGISMSSTLIQHKCDDKLSIALPSYDKMQELVNDDKTLDRLVPAKDAVYKAYVDDRLATPEAKRLAPAGSNAYYAVFGNPSNNTYNLYSNEEEFYNELSRWTENNIRTVYGIAGETLDSNTQEFLEALIDYLYMQGWGHVPTVPISIDTNTSKDATKVESKYVMRGLAEMVTNYDNAAINLHEFLLQLCMTASYTVYFDAIIQLARWGERKQTRLVFKDTDLVFDLNSGVATKAVQINGSLKEVDIIDGYRYIISSYLTIGDNKVVGVELKSCMQDESGTKFACFTEISIVDALKLAKTTTIYESELLSADTLSEKIDRQNVADIEVSDNVQFYSGDKLQKIKFSEKGIPAECSQLSMLQVLCSLDNAQEMYTLLKASDSKAAAAVAVQNCISTSVALACNLLHDWIPYMEEFKHLSVVAPSFWTRLAASNPEEGFEVAEVQQQDVQSMHAFDASAQQSAPVQPPVQQPVQQPVQTPVQPVTQQTNVAQDSIYRTPSLTTVAKIMYSGNVIGYVDMEKITYKTSKGLKSSIKYTVVDETQHPGINATEAISVFKLLAQTVQYQYLMTTNPGGLQLMYYENKESLIKFRNTVNSLEA